MDTDLRYPIGKFDPNESTSTRAERISTIRNLPVALAEAVGDLDEVQLDTEYRPGGWTVRQVVHHLADSHLNSFCRFKLALTEDVPTIRAYYEDRWAELPDSLGPVETSLAILEGVHARWVQLLESMDDESFARRLDHPESGGWDLDGFLALYDWHSKHHTAHITSLRGRMGW